MYLDQEHLRKLGGLDEGPVKNLVERFSQSLPERIAAIGSAHRDANATELRQQLHQLKGGAANFGFIALSNFCRAAESQSFAVDLTELQRLAQASAEEWKSIGDHF